jgi:hypothetical protein
VSAPVVEVLGVRHHGPGSARSVVAALDALQPEVVLVEGPSDADGLLRWIPDAAMEPPVALLAHEAGAPRHAVFWPFAVFSPEWQALRWAAAAGVTARFCDLPSGAVLARPGTASPDADSDEEPDEPRLPPGERGLRTDPLAVLADAAGYDDPERWWEDLVEQRHGLAGGREDRGPFAALTEAMAAVREHAPAPPPGEALVEERREAHMRQVLRAALRGGAGRVAVVCGAWHAPALAGPLPPASRDGALLKGLPKVRTAVSWVPWSHSRLAQASGYGAGVPSPGWYHHLFTAPDRPVTRWLTKVAGELRRADLPVSSAHVIEAVRLADTLAVLRGRPLAGLAEVTEATRSVLCEGDEAMLALVTERLVVGEALGAVPDGAPTVPLAADLLASARRLRLRQDAAGRALDLDLRVPGDLDRSRFLHRLLLLEVPWGEPARSQVRSTGTFRESWSLRWRPELAVAVVAASLWGTTVEAAAAARVAARAGAASATLADVTHAVESALLADLPSALPDLLAALDARAAADLDVLHLMDALPPLVRSLQYGDVRGTDTAALAHVADALAARIGAALPAAVGGLDDDAAAELRRRVDAVHEALALRASRAGGDDVRSRWLDVLAAVAGRADVHGLLAGRVTRLLLDAGRLEPADLGTRLAAALSVGVPPPAQGAWLEGLLGGGGLLLAHDPALLGLVDEWLTGLAAEDFPVVLPLLRRTFSTFEHGERRLLGEQVRRGHGAGSRRPGGDGGWDVDDERGRPALRTALAILMAGGTA